MVSIYMAGPLFCKAELDFNAELAALLRGEGHEVYLPQDYFQVFPPAGPERDAIEEDLFLRDVAMIEKSEVFLMIMDGRVPDEGACFELGYAYSKGKICVALKTDVRVSEQGGDNIMLSVPLKNGMARSIPELLQMLSGM